MVQAAGADVAQTVAGVDADADVSGEANDGSTDSAFNVDMHIGFTRAGEIEVEAANADFQVRMSDVETLQVHVSFSRTQVEIEVDRDTTGERVNAHADVQAVR